MDDQPLDASIRDLVRELPQPVPSWTWRLGTVAAVNTGPPLSLDVDLAGAVVEDVRYLASYTTPTVGHDVWCVVSPDGALIVVGRIA